MQWKAGIQLNLRSTQCKAGIRSTQYLEICSGPVCTDIHQCLFQCQIKRGGGLTKQSFSGQCQRNVRETETPCSQTSKDEWNAQGSKSWRAIEHFFFSHNQSLSKCRPFYSSYVYLPSNPASLKSFKKSLKIHFENTNHKGFLFVGHFCFPHPATDCCSCGWKIAKKMQRQ